MQIRAKHWRLFYGGYFMQKSSEIAPDTSRLSVAARLEAEGFSARAALALCVSGDKLTTMLDKRYEVRVKRKEEIRRLQEQLAGLGAVPGLRLSAGRARRSLQQMVIFVICYELTPKFTVINFIYNLRQDSDAI
jgi:hypothetical protein